MYHSSLPQPRNFDKWSKFKKLSEAMAERILALDNPALTDRGLAMANCAKFLVWRVCPDCGTAYISNAFLCRDRLCPTCAWRLSMRRYAEMIQVFEHTGIGLDESMSVAMLTVTVKNVTIEHLSDAITQLLSAWSKLMKRRPVKRLLLGWARSLEITNSGKGYHPHIHAILVMPKGEYIDQRDWADFWRESLSVDYTPIVDIRLAYNSPKAAKKLSVKESSDSIAARISVAVEALKGPVDIHVSISPSSSGPNDYTSAPHEPHGSPVTASNAARALEYSFKPNVLSNVPQDELAAFAAAIKGRRLVSYGGIIANARKELKLKDDDLPEEGEMEIPLCSKCGVSCTEIIFEWANGRYYKREESTPSTTALTHAL